MEGDGYKKECAHVILWCKNQVYLFGIRSQGQVVSSTEWWFKIIHQARRKSYLLENIIHIHQGLVTAVGTPWFALNVEELQLADCTRHTSLIKRWQPAVG